MPTIFDNIEKQLLAGLFDCLEISERSDFCVGYFNLRGWKQVAQHIDKYSGFDEKCCRLLIGMQKAPEELIRDFFSKKESDIIDNSTASAIKKRLALEFKDQLTIGFPTEEDEIGLRQLSSQIKSKKVVVKLFLRHSLHAKLYLVFRDDKINPVIGFVGSSNLTFAGLSKQGELNVDVLEKDPAFKLANWFNDRWNDRWCLDISKELAEIIDSSWASDRLVPPFHVYLKMAYHLSREARAGIATFKLPKVFKEELLEFQQKAVLVAAHHLNNRDGVLIGDVVGLGKTITATAVAKIFEEDHFLETLILCPKNLTNMWEDYVHKYQLRAKVLSQSMVQSRLPTLRRYRLVIIDESHNLRNREGKRYKAIEEYIKLNDSKVVLLTATPYNKSYHDLSNQLRLFIPEGKDLGISPERFIEYIGGKVEFMSKHQTPIRSLAAFEKSEFADDWRELMRLYLVRRTRSFIKENYAELDPANGRKFLTFSDGRKSYFPDRLPKKVEYEFKKNDPSDQYATLYSQKVVDIINGLNLPRYGLGQVQYQVAKPSIIPTKEEIIILQNLGRAGARLKGFARTNLFKRLESSGHSFLLSVSRHVLRNFLFLYACENKLALPIGKQEAGIIDDFLYEDLDIEGLNGPPGIMSDENSYYSQAGKIYSVLSNQHKKSYNWIRCEFFSNVFKSALIGDSQELLRIIHLIKQWDPEKDRQLNALYELCTKTHPKEKVLVFTQYADTANYLAEQLKKRKVDHLESVTGDDENPTSFAYRFSPESNEKKAIVKGDQEIRVLVSTDVLSEGQNLQDCHIILNYDLPWAIIRLIQRAGRVDRIGQKAEQIICYSFLPEDGIEQIINLRGRLTNRIRQNAEVVGADETFFEGDPINIEDLYNEKAGILDDDEDGEVDLASYAYQIWKNATDVDPKLKKLIPELPDVIYSTKANPDEPTHEGVVVYTKTADDNDVLAWIDNKGEIITQSQLTILKAAQCQPDNPGKFKLSNHHKLVEKAMDHIKVIETDLGGQLGKQSSVRYRVYQRLNRFYLENQNTLFVNDSLKRAIDDIYNFTLREFAREALGRELKSGVQDDDLSSMVISLREDDKLCHINEDENRNREPRIICSLGLKND